MTSAAMLAWVPASWTRAVAGWRGLSREDIAATFVFAFAYTVYNRALYSRLLLQTPVEVNLLDATVEFVFHEISALTLMFGVVAADAIVNRWARLGTLALSVLVSGSIAALLAGLFWDVISSVGEMGVLTLTLGFVVARGVKGAIARSGVWALAVALAALTFRLNYLEGVDDPGWGKDFFTFAGFKFWEWVQLGGAATFVYFDRRKTRAARARMHAAELDRARSAKRALESRLQAMQARVEPQFLFNTLAQVHDLYNADAAQAERMLDELIAYLRAAMPKMRDTSSTVGQELDLVRAYLGIVRLRLGERLAFKIETSKDVADVRMPPMMLLPLVDHTIVHGIAESQANGEIRIHAAVVDGRVRLEIADSGIGFLPVNEGEAIVGIRERLAALFQSDASLALHKRDANTTEAVLQIPLEVTEPSAP